MTILFAARNGLLRNILKGRHMDTHPEITAIINRLTPTAGAISVTNALTTQEIVAICKAIVDLQHAVSQLQNEK